MAYGTADEDLLTVLVMFRYGELSSFGILAKEKQDNHNFQIFLSTCCPCLRKSMHIIRVQPSSFHT